MKYINTNKDYKNNPLIEERGFYRIYYYCQECNKRIGFDTYDKDRLLTRNTILKHNETPIYCPYCGGKL